MHDAVLGTRRAGVAAGAGRTRVGIGIGSAVVAAITISVAVVFVAIAVHALFCRADAVRIIHLPRDAAVAEQGSSKRVAVVCAGGAGVRSTLTELTRCTGLNPSSVSQRLRPCTSNYAVARPSGAVLSCCTLIARRSCDEWPSEETKPIE